jgi:hypothetical protein
MEKDWKIIDNSDEKRSLFPMITPTLAMIYQITNNKEKSFEDTIGDSFNFRNFQKNDSIRKIKLSYEEALEATKNIDSEVWNDKIRRIIYNLCQDLMYRIKIWNNTYMVEEPYIKLDFLIEIFKQEALERQKGNITFIHSRNIIFKVINSFINIITNQNTKYLPRCRLKQKSPKKAKDKAKEIYDSLPDNDFKSLRPDNIKFIGDRLVSANLSLLNNIYVTGESSFFWFVEQFQGNMTSFSDILNDQIKDKKLFKKVNDFLERLNINPELSFPNFKGQSMLLISVPEEKLEDYVFTSNFGGRFHPKYDIIDFLQKYLNKRLWGKDFSMMYSTQFRIMDICYDRYGKGDGIEIFEFDQYSIDERDIQFTIKNKFTPKELQKLSNLTDLPSAIQDLSQWPNESFQSEDQPIDLLEINKLLLLKSPNLNMKSPKPISNLDVKSPKPISNLDVKSPKPISNLNMKSPKPISNLNMKSPKPISNLDVKSPKPISNLNMKSPKPISNLNMKSPKPISNLDVKSPKPISKLDVKSPKPISKLDVKSPKP